MLTEIKVRYEGNKCSKCSREVKQGWTAYFENVDGKKSLYCKPCGDTIKQKEETDDKSLKESQGYVASKELVEEILSRLILVCEGLPAIDNKIREIENLSETLKQTIDANTFDLNKRLESIEKLIKAIPSPKKGK